MSTSLLDLSSVELVSTLHTAPANGAPSSSDYYDGELEKVTDLTTLAAFINNTLLPIFNALPELASAGLLGTSIYSDVANQDALVFDSVTGDPLTVTDSMRVLYGQIQTMSTTLTNMAQQVAGLQARLSASSQNDISLALQSMTNTLAQNASQIQSLTTSISVMQLLVGAEADVNVATPSIAGNATSAVTITWPAAFADNTYSVSYSLEDASGFLSIHGFTYEASGVGIIVTVKNSDTTVAHTGTIHAIARANTNTA